MLIGVLFVLVLSVVGGLIVVLLLQRDMRKPIPLHQAITPRRKWLVIAALVVLHATSEIMWQQFQGPMSLAEWLDPWRSVMPRLLALPLIYGPAMLAKSQTRWLLPVCLLCLLISIGSFVGPSFHSDFIVFVFLPISTLAWLIAIASRIFGRDSREATKSLGSQGEAGATTA
jgi:hypothetical protein